MNDSYVRDQVILITGGSKGIGFATAQALTARGARVALLARGQGTLGQACAALPPGQAQGYAVDVCDKGALETVFDAVHERWGRIDGVINNVGFQFGRRIERVPEDELRRLIDLNFISTVLSCQLAIPRLRANGGGRIVNVSSATVRHDNEFAHLGIYSATKAAVDHFTEALREEVKPDGIMVTLFSPGAVATGSVANFEPEVLADAMAAWLEKGPKCDGILEPAVVGQALANCFEFPPGAAIEFVEVRPQTPTPKMLEGAEA